MDPTLRAATAVDCEWLWQTKTRCLRTYVEQTYGAWSEDFQWARFDASFKPAEFQVVVHGGHDVGFLACRETAEEIWLLNIMIAPEFQNRGFGTAVIRGLLTEVGTRRLPVRLQVMKVNPARRLYERLGFVITEETATHYRMAWAPP